MASVSDFLKFTVDQRLPIYSDQIIQDAVLLRWLKDKGRIKFNQGGDGFTFRVRKAQSSLVRAIGDWSPGQAKTATVAQTLEGDYAAYGSEIMISRLQRKRNEGADSTGFVENLFEQTLNEHMQDFQDYLNSDLAAGDGSQGGNDEATPAEGLVSIVDTDNTHYGVTRSSNSWWQSKTQAVTNNFLDDDDTDGVVNGVQSLRLCFLNCCLGSLQGDKGVSKNLGTSKSKPDLLYSGLASFNNYCMALQPQQQYTNGARNDPGAEVAFMSVPWMWDGYASSDRIDILNSKAMWLLVVGGTIVYRDNEDELGISGTPRASAVGLCSQLQFLSHRPNVLGFVSNTD